MAVDLVFFFSFVKSFRNYITPTLLRTNDVGVKASNRIQPSVHLPVFLLFFFIIHVVTLKDGIMKNKNIRFIYCNVKIGCLYYWTGCLAERNRVSTISNDIATIISLHWTIERFCPAMKFTQSELHTNAFSSYNVFFPLRNVLIDSDSDRLERGVNLCFT